MSQRAKAGSFGLEATPRVRRELRRRPWCRQKAANTRLKKKNHAALRNSAPLCCPFRIRFGNRHNTSRSVGPDPGIGHLFYGRAPKHNQDLNVLALLCSRTSVDEPQLSFHQRNPSPCAATGAQK